MALPKALNFYSFEELDNFSYSEIEGTKYFDIYIEASGSHLKISAMPTVNMVTVAFSATSRVDRWECRATRANDNYGVGIGLLVASGLGVSDNVEKQFDFSYSMLTLGDGDYRISMYVQLDGIWYGGDTYGDYDN